MSWLPIKWFKRKKQSGVVVEYLPDADEIERSPAPPYAQLTIHFLIFGMVVFGVWATFSQLEQVVVAQGRLVNPLPNIVIQPLETSIVQSVDVRAGQVVKAGEQLAVLDSTFAQADEAQLRERLTSLEIQISGLNAELIGTPTSEKTSPNADEKLQSDLLIERRANYRAQQSRMNENVGRLRAALSTNRSDQRLISGRLKSFKELEEIQEKLVAQKYSAQLQLLEAQQRSKEVERELELAINREQELRRELGAFEAEKVAFESGWRQKTMEDLLAISRERDAIQQQLQKADRRSNLITLTSPTDAVVLEIAKLSPGSIAKGAETFFTLVPINAKLEAEVQINSVDVGYIRKGHTVHLKLDAFPFQRHGMLEGKVRFVSEDAFKRDQGSKGALDTYYLAKISLDSEELSNLKEGARLIPGMSLSGEIVVGKRSVISYFAWPLTKGLDEAIREPK